MDSMARLHGICTTSFPGSSPLGWGNRGIKSLLVDQNSPFPLASHGFTLPQGEHFPLIQGTGAFLGWGGGLRKEQKNKELGGAPQNTFRSPSPIYHFYSLPGWLQMFPTKSRRKHLRRNLQQATWFAQKCQHFIRRGFEKSCVPLLRGEGFIPPLYSPNPCPSYYLMTLYLLITSELFCVVWILLLLGHTFLLWWWLLGSDPHSTGGYENRNLLGVGPSGAGCLGGRDKGGCSWIMSSACFPASHAKWLLAPFTPSGRPSDHPGLSPLGRASFVGLSSAMLCSGSCL